jgi:hypothetical protein
MAMQQRPEPEITQKDPRAYYLWLTASGMDPVSAATQVQQRFGAPPSQKDQQKQQENAALGQALGGVAGTAAGVYIYNNAGDLINKFTGAKAPADVAAQLNQSGTLNISRPVPSPTTTVDGSGATVDLGGASSSAPQVISTDGATSTIQTPTGPQQVPTESLNDPGFWSSVNWAQVAQGAIAIAQLYNAYKSYQKGDKVGAGISATSGAVGGAAALGSQTAASAVPIVGAAAEGYRVYKELENISNMPAGSKRDRQAHMLGAQLAQYMGPVGHAIGAVARFSGSSKKMPQLQRDAIRGVLKENGILDDKFQGTLADGSTYDFGKDGSTLKWKNLDKIAEAQPDAWNAAVPAADALAASYGFVGQKASDIAAWYAKGAVSNAGNDRNTALANMQHFAKQQGITQEAVKNKLDEALKDNRINQDKYNYYMSGAQQLLGNAGPSASNQPVVKRAAKGQVARQSAGLYRDDKGKLVAAGSMRKALERSYGKTKDNKKDKEL